MFEHMHIGKRRGKETITRPPYPRMSVSEETADSSIEAAMRVELTEALAKNAVFSTTHHPQTGATFKVVHEAALRKSIDDLFAKARSKGERTYKEKLFELLPAVVGSDPMLTADQVSHGDFHARPLLYIPATTDAATDPTAIKNSSFHHFVNDFVKDVREKRPAYPTLRKGNDTISPLEAKIAVLIFHPDYGGGYRTEQGGVSRLMVRSKKTENYEPFSGEFLKSHGIGFRTFFGEFPQEKGSTERPKSMREGAAIILPHLVAKGLIRPVEDFKQITYGLPEMRGREAERSGVSPSGARMIHGVLHYIGKEFVGKPVRIVELSSTVGAVVDMSGGVERVTHTFNIISRELAKAGKSNMFLAGAPLTQTKRFSAEAIALPRRADESLEQYRDRTEKTDRGLAHLLLQVFPEHPGLAQMLRDRPAYEQASIAQAAYLLERDKQSDRFDALVKKYGEPGARTFLVTGNDDVLRDAMFRFAESAPENKVREVFNAYGRVIDTIDNLGAYLREQFGTADPDTVHDITSKIFKRGTAILAAAYERHSDPEQLTRLVESVRADTQLFLDSCRTLKSKGDLSLENIRDCSLEMAIGDTISDRDAEAIKQIQTARYEGKYPPDLEQELRQGLTSALESPYSRFYIYRKSGEILTYVRFDDLTVSGKAVRTHAASFMTNPKFEGGALGQALFAIALQKERERGVSVYAECDPSLEEKYREFGFEVRARYEDRGVPTLAIELPSYAAEESLREAA